MMEGGDGTTIEDYCQQKENVNLAQERMWGYGGMLLAWCYQQGCNVRIYSVQ